MSQTKVFKLIIQPTVICRDLLKYIVKRIDDINTLGAEVRVEKISVNDTSDELTEMLRRDGITRLPALRLPDGGVVIGITKIVELFEENLTKLENHARFGPGGGSGGSAIDTSDFGSNPDLADFWGREMFAGQDKHGRRIPRVDKDESDDEADELQARMADYRRNVPAHRGGGRRRERDITPPRRAARAYDNIASSESEDDYESPPRRRGGQSTIRLGRTDDARDDALDQQMLDAWLDNNPQD